MSTLINSFLLKTDLFKTLAKSSDREPVKLVIDYKRTLLYLVFFLCLIYYAFILKARYTRWKLRRVPADPYL
jgi:hypothetical protein